MSENVPLKKLLISSSQYPKTQNLTHLKGKNPISFQIIWLLFSNYSFSSKQNKSFWQFEYESMKLIT